MGVAVADLRAAVSGTETAVLDLLTVVVGIRVTVIASIIFVAMR
jgi:hypothetical protein